MSVRRNTFDTLQAVQANVSQNAFKPIVCTCMQLFLGWIH
jgi:hypothetical protein